MAIPRTLVVSREIAVQALTRQGKSAQQIAQTLRVSKRTVTKIRLRNYNRDRQEANLHQAALIATQYMQDQLNESRYP